MTYNPNIPIANNKLAVSQPQIQTNFSVANTVFNIDHYTYTDTTAIQGKHIWVELPILDTGVHPLPGDANQGVLFTSAVTVSNVAQTQLWYFRDGVANNWQLTRADEVNGATFGTYTNYPVPSNVAPYPPSDPAVPNQFGGWTFLPGNMLLQYGRMVMVGDQTTVKFPIRFSQLYSITATHIQGQASTTSWGIDNITSADFIFTVNSETTGAFYWQAVGV